MNINDNSIIQRTLMEQMKEDLSEPNYEKAVFFLDKIADSETADLLRAAFVQSCNQPEMLAEETLSGLFDEFLEDWGTAHIGTTIEAVETQKQLGIKFWQETVRKKLYGELGFLFNYAYFTLIIRFQTSLDNGDDRLFIKELLERMPKLVDAKGLEGQEMLRGLALFNLPGQDFEESTLFTKLMSAICSEVAGIYMKIPYFKLARRGQNPQNN